MKDQYELICNLLDELIHDAQGRMYEMINFKPQDIRISAPEFFIELFQQALATKYMFREPSGAEKGRDYVYRGITFIPCYQMEVAVWHIHYPLYQEDWMLRKISLLNPQTILHNDHLKEIVVNLTPFMTKFSKSQFPNTN